MPYHNLTKLHTEARSWAPHKLTSSSAVAERPRCQVGQFWLKYEWKTIILSTKRCRCQKTKSIDLLHNKSTFVYKKTVTAFWALFDDGFRGKPGNECCSS